MITSFLNIVVLILQLTWSTSLLQGFDYNATTFDVNTLFNSPILSVFHKTINTDGEAIILFGKYVDLFKKAEDGYDLDDMQHHQEAKHIFNTLQKYVIHERHMTLKTLCKFWSTDCCSTNTGEKGGVKGRV